MQRHCIQKTLTNEVQYFQRESLLVVKFNLPETQKLLKYYFKDKSNSLETKVILDGIQQMEKSRIEHD